MENWAIALICTAILMVPVITIILAVVVLVKKPKQNKIFGYRTKRTLSCEKTWELANKLWGECALICEVLGLVVLSVILYFTIPNHLIIGCITSAFLIIITGIIPIIFVEVNIRKSRCVD